MTSEFDAIDYVRELEAAGVPHFQATIHAKALTVALDAIRSELRAMGRLLTALISEVKEDISESEMQTQRQIMASETQLTDRIAVFRDDFNARSAASEAKFGAFREDVNLRFVTLEAKFDAFRDEVNLRFVALEAKFDAFRDEVNLRFVTLEAKVEARMKALEDRMTAFEAKIEARMKALEDRMSALEARVEGIASTLDMMKWVLAIVAGSQVAIMGMVAKLLMG